MDAIQQLELALLGSLASWLIDLPSEMLQPSLIPMTPNVQHPQAYTTTWMAPPPTSVPMVGLTSSSSSSVQSISKMTEIPSKQHHIVPTSLQTSKSPPVSALHFYPHQQRLYADTHS